MRRLRRHGQALGVSGSQGRAAADGATIQLRQRDDGSVLSGDLEQLRVQELAAAQRRDYSRAGLLHDIQWAVGPKPRLTLEDCAPAGVEVQLAFFLQNGFCILHNVLTAVQLSRAQAAWSAAEEKIRPVWEADALGGGQDKTDRTFFDIPNLLALDDVFIDLVDSPAVVPLLSRITGNHLALDPSRTLASAAADGCMRVDNMGGRIVPSEGNAMGYTRWHRDKSSSVATDNPSYRHVKVFTNLWDIPINGGGTSYVVSLPPSLENVINPPFLSDHYERFRQLTSAGWCRCMPGSPGRIGSPWGQKEFLSAASTLVLVRKTTVCWIRGACPILSKQHCQRGARSPSIHLVGTRHFQTLAGRRAARAIASIDRLRFTARSERVAIQRGLRREIPGRDCQRQHCADWTGKVSLGFNAGGSWACQTRGRVAFEVHRRRLEGHSAVMINPLMHHLRAEFLFYR